MIKLNRSWCIREHKNHRDPYISCMIDAGYNSKGKKKYSTLVIQRFILNIDDNSVVIDHINHNTFDNRKSNLRTIKQIDNSRYRKSKNINNKSGYRNVAVINGKFVVQLEINGKNTKLGEFTDVDKAGEFAEEMRQKYYGKYAGKS